MHTSMHILVCSREGERVQYWQANDQEGATSSGKNVSAVSEGEDQMHQRLMDILCVFVDNHVVLPCCLLWHHSSAFWVMVADLLLSLGNHLHCMRGSLPDDTWKDIWIVLLVKMNDDRDVVSLGRSVALLVDSSKCNCQSSFRRMQVSLWWTHRSAADHTALQWRDEPMAALGLWGVFYVLLHMYSLCMGHRTYVLVPVPVLVPSLVKKWSEPSYFTQSGPFDQRCLLGFPPW